MPDRHDVKLGPAQETLLIPLYGRAVETRRRRPLARDQRAVEMVESIDYDFSQFDGGHSLVGSVLRGLVFDHWVAEFLRANPQGTVVEVGAGLNTRFERLDNGTCHWVDLDLPDSMALRRNFFTETDRRTMVEASIVDESWVPAVREHPAPYFFVAEAVLIYLDEDDARRAVGHIQRHFPGSPLAFDTWGSWIVRNKHRHDALSKLSATLTWACDDPHAIESWHEGIRMISSHTLARPPRAVRSTLPARIRSLLPAIGVLPQTRSYRLNLFTLAPKPTPPARADLRQLVLGYMSSHAIGLATRWRVADLFGDRTRTAADLAGELATPPPTTTRLLRALAALGVLVEETPNRFRLGELGHLLRTDRPDSAHGIARMFTEPTMVRGWLRLEHSVRTGRTGFDEEFGTDFFTHLAADEELSRLFNTAMSTATRGVAATLPDHYDFARHHTVVDVGGGDGTLLAAVLARHERLRGVLYDSPSGLAEAPATLGTAGVTERCDLTPGDFFTSVPEGADLYLLKSVVHDWDDERAATILRHVRNAMAEHGRVLIVEPVLPDTVPAGGPAGAYLSDLNMLVNVGGRERTRADFESLCSAAGLDVAETAHLPAEVGFGVVIAVPAHGSTSGAPVLG